MIFFVCFVLVILWFQGWIWNGRSGLPPFFGENLGEAGRIPTRRGPSWQDGALAISDEVSGHQRQLQSVLSWPGAWKTKVAPGKRVTSFMSWRQVVVKEGQASGNRTVRYIKRRVGQTGYRSGMGQVFGSVYSKLYVWSILCLWVINGMGLVCLVLGSIGWGPKISIVLSLAPRPGSDLGLIKLAQFCTKSVHSVFLFGQGNWA